MRLRGKSASQPAPPAARAAVGIDHPHPAPGREERPEAIAPAASPPFALDRLTGPTALVWIVAIAFFMEALDSTIVATALPRMATSFHTQAVALSPGVTVYLLALAVVIPASGWMSDRVGARLAFLSGLLLFTAASALCGATFDIASFVAARALQGIGAALMSPIGRLVLLRQTEKRDLVRVMNWVAFPGLLGPVLGPPVGGLITTYFGWRWIFLINVPFGIVGALMVLKIVPRSRRADPDPFDRKGFILNSLCLAGLIFGAETLAKPTGEAMVGAVALAASGALLILAVRHARRSRRPLIGLEAARIPSFVASTLTGGWLYRMSMTAPVFVLPLLLQLGLGYSPAAAGGLLLAHTSGDALSKTFTGRVLRTFGFRRTMIANALLFGALILACGFLEPSSPLAAVLALLFVSGVARSLVMTGVTALQFADVPQEMLTGASTLASAINPVATALGVAASAVLLNLLISAHPGASAPGMSEFRGVMIGAAVLSATSALAFTRLHRSAGAGAHG